MRNGVSLYIALVAVAVSACHSQPNQWQDLDYSSVYKRAKQRELDAYYTMPTIVGCVDEDLYNCQ